VYVLRFGHRYLWPSRLAYRLLCLAISMEASMTQRDHISVTAYRVGESEHQDPSITLPAFHLEVSADGSLSIDREQGARAFGRSGWGSFEVTRLSVMARR
jgi:hypothetical protein